MKQGCKNNNGKHLINFPYFLLVGRTFFSHQPLLPLAGGFADFAPREIYKNNATFIYKTLLGQAALNASLFAGTRIVNKWPK